jgi:protein-export membrane protein SecD
MRWRARQVRLLALALSGLLAIPAAQAAEIVRDPANSYLLLGVNVDTAVNEHMNALLADIRAKLARQGIQYSDLRLTDDIMAVSVANPAQRAEAADILAGVAGATGTMDDGNGQLSLRLPQSYRHTVQTQIQRKLASVLRDRLKADGIADARIGQDADGVILVTLTGSHDLDALKREIAAPVDFSLRLVDMNDFFLADKPFIREALAGHVPDGEELLWNGEPSDSNATAYLVQRRVLIQGDQIEQAAGGIDPRSREPVVYFRFDAVGAAEFAAVTRLNVGKAFAIVLNSRIIWAPVIREPILGGVGQISGNLTADSANRLANLMTAAAISAVFTVIEEHVGAVQQPSPP